MSIRPTTPAQLAALSSSITGMSPRDLALQLKSNLKPKSGVLHAPELITGKSLMSVMGSMRPGLAMQPNPVGLARSYAKLLGATVDLFA